MDVFLYNGNIERHTDLRFLEFVSNEQKSEELLLVLVTQGGSADAAYKMGRYIQARYKNISVLVSGLCKSAGTLLAIAAHEIIFSPYGELGPLDVQIVKPDDIRGFGSGLNTSEAFMALETRTQDMFHSLVSDIVNRSNGIISFPTASISAASILSSLYGPIFSKIDPEEVGARSRAMRMGVAYGLRLGSHSENLKGDALVILAHTYPDHGFVIDSAEAMVLFNNVREATDTEIQFIEKIGINARMPGAEQIVQNLTTQYHNMVSKKGAENESADKKKKRTNHQAKGDGESEQDTPESV